MEVVAGILKREQGNNLVLFNNKGEELCSIPCKDEVLIHFSRNLRNTGILIKNDVTNNYTYFEFKVGSANIKLTSASYENLKEMIEGLIDSELLDKIKETLNKL